MRVIAGKFRRRVLASPPGPEARPMLGRMRQTLFDILAWDVPGCVFADLYAGTGAVGIEALSRGAKHALFVESSRRMAEVIRRNLETVGAADQADVRISPVLESLQGLEADIYFLGPPYDAAGEYEESLRALSGLPGRWVIAQHGKGTALAERYGALRSVRVVKVGSNRLTFFRPEAPAAEDLSASSEG